MGVLSTRFEVGSSSTTIPDPMSKAVAFLAHFEQVETNDLDLTNF